MDRRGVALLLLLLLAALPGSPGKPISLTYRCPCRYFEILVSKSQIRHLKILTIPGCPLQVIARLKNSSKQICIDPKLKWIQEYLEKYLQKHLLWVQGTNNCVYGDPPSSRSWSSQRRVKM